MYNRTIHKANVTIYDMFIKIRPLLTTTHFDANFCPYYNKNTNIIIYFDT